MPRRGSLKPPAEPVVKPHGCDFNKKKETGVKTITLGGKTIVEAVV